MQQTKGKNLESSSCHKPSAIGHQPSKKVLLIFPREKGIKFSNDTLYPFPILGLTLLASLFPKTYEVKIINEAIEKVDFNAEVDLVGVTGLTCVIKRAYAIADRFRERGVKGILGGVHPSLLPDEAKEHADSVFIGETEGIFGQLLKDFEGGTLKPFYKNEGWSDLKGMPFPRRDLLSKRYSPLFKAIETTRGCPHQCEFCSVPTINGRRYRTRPLKEVDQELTSIINKKGEYLFLADDNVMAREDYALSLFEIFKRHGVRWMGFATVQIAKKEALLKKAQESGCISLFIGFESLIQENLDDVWKRFGDSRDLSDLIRTIQSTRIGLPGSFIFGFDGDEAPGFKRTVEFF